MKNSNFISVGLLVCAATFYAVGVVSIAQLGLSIFFVGLATLFVSVAMNPIALETPSDRFNWKLLPLHVKVLQETVIIFVFGAALTP